MEAVEIRMISEGSYYDKSFFHVPNNSEVLTPLDQGRDQEVWGYQQAPRSLLRYSTSLSHL
jgi:hypothetical protein